MKALMTLSGGIDSVTLAHIMKRAEWDLTCVYLKYGSRVQERELECSRLTAEKLEIPLIELPFSIYEDISRSFILGNTEDYEKGGQFWLDGRNGLIAFILAIMAASRHIEHVFLGTNADDFDGVYLDTTKEFYDSTNALIRNSIRSPVKVSAPFLDWDMPKSKVIQEGEELGIDWVKYTHSCSSSNQVCLDYDNCESCYWRRQDFHDAGLSDPFAVRRP